MNKEAVNAVKLKDKLWKRYHFCGTSSNYQNYREARNKAKMTITKARLNFERKISEEVKDNPKSFWKYVKQSTKPPVKQQRVINQSGTLSTNDEESANNLNSYFATVFTEEGKVELNRDMPEMTDPLTSMQIDEKAIMDILKVMKVDKAAGPDGIHPRVLVEAKEQICSALKIMFQRSIEHERIPKDWKNATVVPIFKKGKRNLPENYRPVSLTCIVCKVMERILRDRIVKYFTEKSLLSSNQYGFVPGRSCTLQLLVCMEEWSKQLDAGNQVDIIYTDFSKAFDTVSHTRLLHKLALMGVGGNFLAWIQDFLTGRSQKVRVENSLLTR
jgi:uncharacterized protein (UPF0335 family)